MHVYIVDNSILFMSTGYELYAQVGSQHFSFQYKSHDNTYVLSTTFEFMATQTILGLGLRPRPRRFTAINSNVVTIRIVSKTMHHEC